MRRMLAVLVIGCVLVAGAGVAAAADMGTKDEAVAMVKKAVGFIKANGAEKAYAEFSNPKGQFVDRDLYIAVYDMNGKCLAHGANAKMIGRDLLDNKDVDGKEFVKERVEMMKKDALRLAGLQVSQPDQQPGRAQVHVHRTRQRRHRGLRDLQEIAGLTPAPAGPGGGAAGRPPGPHAGPAGLP